MSAKHTPGPWEYPEHAYILSGSDDGPNFSGGDWEVLPPLGESGPVAICSSRENDRLIAAAPDLLEACKAAKKFLEPDLVEPGRTVFWNLVEAIKKAEGAA